MNDFDFDNFDWNDWAAQLQDTAGVFDIKADKEIDFSEGMFPRFDDTGRAAA